MKLACIPIEKGNEIVDIKKGLLLSKQTFIQKGVEI
jgi:hypothetical protein